ncbi:MULTISPECIES: YceI family protein [Flagellimonas]|uniref:YceI family protein n=1 Tax=Flagellimonas hadalis TaxID=2597517 RepID=A0A5N5J287_9FLAO|nr:YceI family protein [Allomuricauda hadalis]KAB5487533.1 YceI family protein [Allomuricauda hadalis]
MIPFVIHNIKSISTMTLLFIGAFFSAPERETRVWVAPESEVVIKGTTNVNAFTCRYNVQELEVPVQLTYNEKVEQIQFKNAKLKLANDCFDCGGKAINKDFRELLKTERHPQVELRLLHVDPLESDAQKIGVGMEITIAGVARKYQTTLNCVQAGDICVNGSLDLLLSDFGLEPPRKVLGMIKVDNKIKVQFSLKLKEI